MLSSNISSNVRAMALRCGAAKKSMERAIPAGMRAAKEPVRNVLKAELRTAFKVKQDRFLRTWRISVRRAPSLVIENISRGFTLHAQGGMIRPKSGGALLIPINTAGGTRIGTKKFYSMIDWLHQEKMLMAKDGILYVRVPMNASKRGGVAAGTRVQKKFRSRFTGPRKRPSGFDIKLNEQGLTPIAIIKRSITMNKRFNMQPILRNKLVPIVLRNVANEWNLSQR